MNCIGLHVINSTRLPLTSGAAKPRICLLMDVSVDYYRQVRSHVGDNCVIFIRWYEPSQVLNAPYDNAQGWFGKHKADILAMKHPKTVFLGYNEIPDGQAVPYSDFEYWRGQILHVNGCNCGYLAASVGTPDFPMWAYHKKWLADMHKGDYVCLHEYASDLADVGNRFHCGRWAMVPELADKDIAITEWGFDVVEGKGQAGWQRSASPDTFYEANVRYNALLGNYPRVVGAVIFQNGSADQQWAYFDPAPIWPRILAGYKEETVTPIPTVVVEPPIKIDGRQMKQAEFTAHINSLDLKGKYDKVFIHHTASPDETTWDAHNGWVYWKQALIDFYGTKIWFDAQGVKHVGWEAGPHLFVDQVGIGLFTPVTQDGVGVVGNNTRTRHIEIVGNFTTRLPDGDRLQNAIHAAALLLKAGGLNTDALRYHREFQKDTSCPGDKLVANWSWFKGLVAAKLAALNAPSTTDIEAALGAEMQKHIVPLNPTAALERAAAAYGLLPAGNEFDLTIGGVTYRCQAYRSAGERNWQYGVYAKVGDWGNVKMFKRAN